MVLIVAKPPSLLTGSGVMSATMVDARKGLQAVAHRGKPWREKLDLILRQQDDVRLSAQMFVDVGLAAVSERPCPVAYCGALRSEVAGGGTMVPT